MRGRRAHLLPDSHRFRPYWAPVPIQFVDSRRGAGGLRRMQTGRPRSPGVERPSACGPDLGLVPLGSPRTVWGWADTPDSGGGLPGRSRRGSPRRGTRPENPARGAARTPTCGRAASIWGAVRALRDRVLGVGHGGWREIAPAAGGSGASRTRPRTSGEAPGRATRSSPRRACRRCARTRSLEDLCGAVAALEAHLVGAGGAGGAVVEVDEEVAVDLHPTVGRAVDSEQPGVQLGVELVVPG
jgi:hypothetical protein